MVCSRNPGESVVVLPVVLGIRTAEVPATETLITAGLRVWRLANVSSNGDRLFVSACACVSVDLFEF